MSNTCVTWVGDTSQTTCHYVNMHHMHDTKAGSRTCNLGDQFPYSLQKNSEKIQHYIKEQNQKLDAQKFRWVRAK